MMLINRSKYISPTRHRKRDERVRWWGWEGEMVGLGWWGTRVNLEDIMCMNGENNNLVYQILLLTYLTKTHQYG